VGTIAQRSFAGGEVAPAIYPRVDTVKYTTGARTLRNMFVKKHGGVSNRPGTSFVAEVRDSSRATRILPFRHTEALTFILELGNLSVRGVQEGTQIRRTAQNITAVTNANPAVLTYAGADNYANGDEVYVSGIVGPIGLYLNGRNFRVANVNAGANTFELNYLSGTAVNSTAFGLYTSGGTISEVMEIVDTTSGGALLYTEAELFDVQYAQNAEVLTLTHSAHAIRELAATALTTWTNELATLLPEIPYGPSGVTTTRGGGGAKTFKYKVTAIDANFEESLAGIRSNLIIINNGTAANPVVFTTTAAHDFLVGDTVHLGKALEWASGSLPDSDNYVVSAVGSPTTFSIAANTTGFGAWVGLLGAADAWQAVPFVNSAADGTAAAPVVLTWSAVSGAREYNVYKERQGLYGFHGTTATTTYRDEGGNGDALENPPELRPDLNDITTPDADTYPAVVGTIQQRRAFGRSNDNPQTGWASRTTFPNNFTLHFPLQDDDSVKFKLAGEQNELRHILDLGQIVVLTAGGEWVLQGDGGGILTPTQVNPKQVGYNGSSKLKPVLINNNALYVQARGNVIRDLAFDYQVDNYRGNDLTIFSSHLFEGFTIVDWAYQQLPNSIVWAVRSDGVLLGLTYLREQDIWAWHRHDTDGGLIESVCTVPEGDEDVLYMVVKRTINGAVKRYIERMNTRVIDDIEDSIFMDCTKSFDGRHTGVVTMTLSGGTTWAYDETITLTASASTFAAADVGKAVHLVGADGDLIRFTITGYTGVTVVTGRPHKTVAVGMRSTAIGNGSGSWGLAITLLTGLWHLEGETVSIFADGFVVASPNNDAYTEYTVTNGQLTLDRPFVVIHVGIPITADLETLDIDTTQGETMADKKKLTTKVTAWFEDSRGLFSGPKPPSDDDTDPLEGLYEVKLREEESQDEPVELFTGTKTDLLQAQWNSNGRIFLRQVDPVPVSVLAIAPSGMIPFRGGGQ
jgi:hypothetical protein